MCAYKIIDMHVQRHNAHVNCCDMLAICRRQVGVVGQRRDQCLRSGSGSGSGAHGRCTRASAERVSTSTRARPLQVCRLCTCSCSVTRASSTQGSNCALVFEQGCPSHSLTRTMHACMHGGCCPEQRRPRARMRTRARRRWEQGGWSKGAACHALAVCSRGAKLSLRPESPVVSFCSWA